MRILVLGSDGMLGHQLVAHFGHRFEVVGTLRGDAAAYRRITPYLPAHPQYSVDVRLPGVIDELLNSLKPQVVINAIGIVKQRKEAVGAIESIEVNSVFPHRLAKSCAAIGARLVQISTDCVFSGRDGWYTESSTPDAVDLYGRTKLLGELSEGQTLTLRTSIIGLELARKTSLVEWFLAQRGTIKGYTNAIYSGFTTMEFARILESIIVEYPQRSGLYHVASEPIDKFTLLTMLNDRLGRRIEIIPDDSFVCDRSLDGARFRNEFSYSPPSWESMLDELANQIKERYG
ncbi:MAG TPA: SDR family oxidoreductase [Gemmatimonadaceae bacterium]|nr:SDR family oxidoreductase [Gemmatimonadaceae bacterium]